MYTWIISASIGIIISFLLMRSIKDNRSNESLKVLCASFCIVLSCVAVPIGLILISDPIVEYDTHYSKPLTTNIVSIKDNSVIGGEIHGGIFIINGFINEKPVYYFYEIQGSGYVQSSIPAENVVVYEDTEDGIGYIKSVDTWQQVNPEWKNDHLHWFIFVGTPIDKYTIHEIHVPRGSIINDFVLDAE